MWQFAMNSPGKGNCRIGLANGSSLRANRLLTLACFMTIAALHILVLSGFDYGKLKEKPVAETSVLSLTLDMADHTAETWDAVANRITEAAPELPLPAAPLPQKEVPLPEPVSQEIPVIQEASSMASLSEPELPLPGSLSEAETVLPEVASFSASAEGASVHTGNVAPLNIPGSLLASSVSVPQPRMTDAEYLALIMGRLEKNKIYPLSVRKRGIEGDIKVHFTIRQDGTVSELRVADPSGHRFLAQAAFETIRSASPFPVMEGR
ncbi:MAG: energy transducer TonB, partial [Treponema sp.]|nr:energy transducer TonB [Treponema sp.]